jgi:hypothetical protein
MLPAGPRSTVTEAWCSLKFTLTNPAAAERVFRVQAYYTERPTVRYGRDVRVPGRAAVTSWLSVGPAPPQRSDIRRDVDITLYEQTGGEWRPVPVDNGGDRLRSRALPYQKSEKGTSVLLDGVADDTPGADLVALAQAPTSADAESLELVRVGREAGGLSQTVFVVADRFLPAAAEAFDGVSHFVLAGNRLEQDPVGATALRQWVLAGGTLWVHLDRVRPEGLAAVLGSDLRFQVVGRTGVTNLRLGFPGEAAPLREFDRPVELVRVIPDDGDTVLLEANGWPAALTRPVGRGRVVVTTLGGRGWHRPRTAREKRSAFEQFPNLPVAGLALERLAAALDPDPPGETAADALAPMLTADIGYAVVGRGTAVAVFGGFAAVLAAAGVLLRYTRRPERIGWVGPAAAAVTAAAFVSLGAASRQVVPPTAGAVAVLDVAPGTDEAAATGVFAVYRPESGDVRLTAARGGPLDLGGELLQGQVLYRTQTDLGSWRWENVRLPTGVQTGPFHTTVPAGPVRAVARFGPAGVDGQLSAGVFRNPADAVILTPARVPVRATLTADGAFHVGPDALLPAGQFLTDTVLSDAQRRRQEVYRRLLTRPLPKHLDGRWLLLAWADPAEPPFFPGDTDRTVGAVLLVVPLEFDRPAVGTEVQVPRGFVPVSTGGRGGRRAPPTLQSSSALEMPLRFQLPASVLPLDVAGATLHLHIRAPGRRVTVTAGADGSPVTLHTAESPLDPIRVDVADPRLLRPDNGGGLTLTVGVSEPVGGGGGAFDREGGWAIESLTLEVRGRRAGEQ